MLRKIITIMVSAAAVTFVAAQFPWDTGVSDYSSDDSGTPSSAEAASSEYSYESPFSSEPGEGVTEDAFAPDTPPAQEAAPAKSKREKAPRSAAPAAGFRSQKSCPVCNSVKLKKNLYAPHSGQRVHVCSASCLRRVKRNPEAFIKILQSRGEKPES